MAFYSNMVDEYDYMSDIFVNQTPANDIRPGLIKTASRKRKHNQLKKRQELGEGVPKTKPVKVVENERRAEGLSSAINSTNKGFSMLLKMGFLPGTGLGKNRDGITEPIPIVVKTDRKGLGRAEVLKQIQLEKLKIRQKYQEQKQHVQQKKISVEDFRSQLSRKSKEMEVESDLKKCQKICENLDIQNEVKFPAEKWFWFTDIDTQNNQKNENDEEIINEENEDVEMECDFDSDDKLRMLTLYLRQYYFYCIWCGTQYEDERDLSQSCPGNCRDDH